MIDPQQRAPNEDVIVTFDPPEVPSAAPNPVEVAPAAAPLAAPVAPQFAAAPPAYGVPPVPVYPAAPNPVAPHMTTPYGASPIASAPGYAPAPGYPSAPPYANQTYAAPGGAYTPPSAGYAAAYAGAPQKASSGLGLVALLLSLAAAVIASIVVGFFAMQIGIRLSSNGNIDALSYDPLTFLSPARDVVLGAEITFWVATVLGVWALVQGIIAIVKRRGRGMGIAAIIVAVVGPVIFSVIAWIMFAVGLGAGAASFS